MTGQTATPDGHESEAIGSTWLSNAGSLVAGRLVVAMLGWIGTIIVARNLDSEEFGRFAFVFGLLGMMTIVTDLGLGRIALSRVMGPAQDRREFAGSYVILRTALGMVGYLTALSFTVLANYDTEIVTATAIGGLVVILATTSHAYEIILQAKLQLGIVAVAAIVGRTAQLGLITAAVVADGGLLLLLVPAVIAEVVIAVVKIPRAVRLQPLTYVVRPGLWLTLLAEAIPISIGTALATLYFRVDSIMLSKLADFTAVGIYGVAFKFVDVLHFVSLSVSAPLLTVLVGSWPDRPARFQRAVEQTTVIFAALSGALVVTFGLFTTDIIGLLYGPQYLAGSRAVQLLIAGQIIAFWSVIGLTVLTATGNHRRYPAIALTGLVVNVGLNLVAIQRWGFEGAAVTTVVTEVFVVLGMWCLVRQVDGIGGFALRPIRGVVPAVIAGLGVGAALVTFLPWPAAAIGALLAYGIGAAWFVWPSLLRPDAVIDDESEAPTVMIVGHSTSGSGAELVALRYLGALQAAAWSCETACPEGFLAERVREKGGRVHLLPDLQLPSGNKLVAMGLQFCRWLRAAAVIRRVTGPETILVVNGLLALPAVRFAGRSNNAMWLVHDVVVRSDLRLLAKASTGGLAAAAAVSNAAAAFPESLGVATEVLRNGTAWPVAPARSSMADQGPPDEHARPIIGINAMVTPWKGHRIVLDAVATIPGVELDILGGRFPKDADYLEELQRRAAEPDLVGRVRFLGHRDDPLDAMRDWSIAASASVQPEAGPLSVLEAMSLGIPVVATNHGGAAEVLGQAGLLVEPGNPEAMANALRQLLADADLRTRCSAAGRSTIATQLTEQASNEAFLARIERLAARHKARIGRSST